MKIALIITDYGSFNNFLGELAVQLTSGGHEVSVICSDTKVINIEDKFPYAARGIRFYFVSFPRGFNVLKHYRASVHIHKLLKSVNPDVVHVHFTTGIFTTTFIGKPKYLTLGTFHGLGYPVIDNFIRKKVFRFTEYLCFRRLDQIWLLNSFDYNLLKQTSFSGKVKLLETKGLGCNLDKFDPKKFPDNYKNELRTALNISREDFVITFTGRFVSFKGFDTVVRAFRLLYETKQGVSFKLLLIGGRDQIHPTGLSTEEEAWMKDNKDIIAVGFTADVERYLSISDIFAFPSLKEGMPVCIIEALAMEVPVVTANTRGCNDLIRDHINGVLLSEKPDAAELRRAILEIAGNEQLRNTLRQNIAKDRPLLDRQLFVDHEAALYNDLKINT